MTAPALYEKYPLKSIVLPLIFHKSFDDIHSQAQKAGVVSPWLARG